VKRARHLVFSFWKTVITIILIFNSKKPVQLLINTNFTTQMLEKQILKKWLYNYN
jgi:hypothetical protein